MACSVSILAASSGIDAASEKRLPVVNGTAPPIRYSGRVASHDWTAAERRENAAASHL